MIDFIKDNVPDIRFLNDMKDFVYDKKWAESAPNYEMYYMYRSMAKDENDKEKISKNNLRYNITIISPQMLGQEFPKTIGHEHGLVPNEDITYPEIYEVLEGEAIYLLQKRDNNKIIDIYAVKTKAGEKCIVPPSYGHVTINASGKDVIMADWSEKNFKSDYSPLRNNRGAGYYALRNPSVILSEANNPIDWQKNNNYSEIPELKIYNAKDFNWLFKRFGINMDTPMYDYLNNPEKLDFLKHPQKYKWEK